MVLGDGGPRLVLPRLAQLPWKADAVVISESETSQPLGSPLVGQGSGDGGEAGEGSRGGDTQTLIPSGCDSLFMIPDKTLH